MAKFNGFSPTQLVVVDKIYRASRSTLEKAVGRAGSDTWRSVFAQIMGTAAVSDLKNAEQALEESIKAMHMRIGGLSFSVSYEATFTNTNADMLSAPHLASGGGSGHTSFVDEARQMGMIPGVVPMRLGPNFFNMPERDLFGQSKIETFLHELSHHAAGTIDDANGGECYGWTGVTRLKGLGPARAVWNAENVGFFLVWVA